MADLTTVDPVTVVSSKSTPPDDVIVKVNGVSISGWTSVEITAGIESVPRVFSVGMTATPGLVAQAGDPCEIYIGRTKVITGFIDRDTNSGDENNQQLTLVGRGKCCDLVDCSAEWPGGGISGANALQVALKLAEPYNISVNAAAGTDLGPTIPEQNLTLGETAYSIIERITRYAKCLAYEDEEGALLLAQAGKVKAASGVAYGQNVLSWQAVNSADQRFSDYKCSTQSTNLNDDVAPADSNFFQTATDAGVKRHRALYMVADTSLDDYAIPKARTLWEMNRRIGRAQAVTATVDSWRDADGTLWTPNTLLPVAVPGFRGPDTQLLLAEVVFRYGDEGKIAELTLMPAGAFAIEPMRLIQVVPDAEPSA